MEQPRLIVEVSDEQMIRLRRNLQWGQQGHLFRKLIDDMMDFVERYGQPGIALYMTNKVSLLQLMELKEKEKEDGSKKPKAKHPRAQSTRSNTADNQDQKQ